MPCIQPRPALTSALGNLGFNADLGSENQIFLIDCKLNWDCKLLELKQQSLLRQYKDKIVKHKELQ